MTIDRKYSKSRWWISALSSITDCILSIKSMAKGGTSESFWESSLYVPPYTEYSNIAFGKYFLLKKSTPE